MWHQAALKPRKTDLAIIPKPTAPHKVPVDGFWQVRYQPPVSARQITSAAGLRSGCRSRRRTETHRRKIVRLGGYRERSAGRVSVMGRNALDALGQQITGPRMADVTP